jgi:hypothetical protein
LVEYKGGRSKAVIEILYISSLEKYRTGFIETESFFFSMARKSLKPRDYLDVRTRMRMREKKKSGSRSEGD